MPDIELLKDLQAMPLDMKVAHTKARIREWVREYGIDGVYVSLGGKDSRVVLDIVRQMYPIVPAVFVDTGLEYPELRKSNLSLPNVVCLKPKMSFVELIKKYGYPIISKEVCETVSQARKSLENGDGKYSYRLKKLNGELLDKQGRYSLFNTPKYKPLLNVDFLISGKCCDINKKAPIKEYEKKTGRVGITGTMACESQLRMSKWLQNGCNAFDSKRPISNPISFWLENDVLEYIYIYKLDIPSVYGKVEKVYPIQKTMFDYEQGVRYRTTGCERSGCIYCALGCHLEKESRWLRLKETHPRQYEYCIGGGEYNEKGLWQPNKQGLGLGHCFDVLNEIYGKDFIVYK